MTEISPDDVQDLNAVLGDQPEIRVTKCPLNCGYTVKGVVHDNNPDLDDQMAALMEAHLEQHAADAEALASDPEEA